MQLRHPWNCVRGLQIYASYAARFEGRIVQSMIRNDGGTGEFQEKVLPMLGIWYVHVDPASGMTVFSSGPWGIQR